MGSFSSTTAGVQPEAGSSKPSTMAEAQPEASTTMHLARTKLAAAIDSDAAEPLVAAELYAEAIYYFSQARKAHGVCADELDRIDCLARQCRERFDSCEKRVQAKKANAGIVSLAATTASSHMPATSASHVAARPSANAQERATQRQGVSPPNISAESTISAGSKASIGGTVGSALKGVDKKLAKMILDEVLDGSPGVAFDDIVGLKDAKAALHEAIVLPALRPDLFQGIRTPPKGILMFGPPGNGKTLLAKAVASECNSRFFSISASSLTSKWVGEGEKMVRALFAVAAELQPTVIFMDEVDSLLSARSENENEASRRLKTEFLIQFDGVSSRSEVRVILIAATNRPQELDEAVIRRFTRRILIPIPDAPAREAMVRRLLHTHKLEASDAQLRRLIVSIEGYSASDIAALCKEAAMAPLRELGPRIIEVQESQVRAICLRDLEAAASSQKPSLSLKLLKDLVAWNDEYGSYKYTLPPQLLNKKSL